MTLPRPSGAPPGNGTAFAVLLIAAAAVLPYLSTIDDYFIRDDFGVVQLMASKPADAFLRWFHTPWTDFIWGYTPDEVRPFVAVSYQLTALPGAAVPWAHHLFNILLHAANGLLVLVMARRIARLSLPAATFAALVFVLLPVHPESVAWITGRVDSMPALLYAGAFLAYARWREQGRPAAYAASLVIFFTGLFTKQNTITLVGSLAGFDLLVAERPFRPVWKRALAYAPFVAMTAGYLALRLALFGHVAREEQLTQEMLAGFVTLVDRHLAHVIAGDPGASRVLVWSIVVTAVALCFAARPAAGARSIAARVVFFGPVWWAIGVAPILVAGYESPRHVYLAAMGWSILLGVALDSVGTAISGRTWPRAVMAAAAGVLVAYAVLLHSAVREWNEMGAVSERAVRDVTRESFAAREGTLIIVGAPTRSWEWALPFAIKPPFSEDVTSRSYVISPWLLHCCRQQWFDDTRRTLATWSTGPAPDSVIALRWDPATGALSKMSSAENEALPQIADMLSDLSQYDLLDLSIRRLLDSIGTPRRGKNRRR